MHIIIAGCGKLADAIFSACQDAQVSCAHFDSQASRVACAVGIHAGSGRQLKEFHTYCADRCVPIIQASTGQKMPEPVRTIIIDAPNLALPIVYLMGLVKDMHSRFAILGTPKVNVRESHQKSKKSVPGTAVKFAEAVKLPPEAIVSVRNPAEQRALGIPEEHLGRHGFHWISWAFPNLKVELRTEVHGLQPYALGALILAEDALGKMAVLDSGVYPVCV